MRKPYRTIKNDSGEINIIGNNHFKELEYGVPEWNDNPDDLEAYFTYYGEKYYLSEFMCLSKDNPFNTEDLKFDGYKSDSFFSGILVKFSDCVDGVKVFTYISG